jgi:undecaprenyl-phosphate 4-deoxy-4-formamido-L-arabinose transferase
MDDDLQHPPEEVPKMLETLRDDCDVVYGCPIEMSHSISRNFASWITKSIVSRIIRNRQFKHLSAFRAFRTRLRHAFSDFQGPQLSFDLLLSWGANTIVSAEVKHQPRRSGKSNYNLLKLIDHTLVLLTSYSTIPLRIASILGFLVTALGLFIMFYVIVRYFAAGSLPGFPFLASTITIFGGAQMLILGVIGEYLARMYNRSLDKPTYVVLAKSTQKGDEVSKEHALVP